MKLRTKFQDEDFELGEVVEANIYYGGGGRVKVIAESTRGGIITLFFETLKGMNEMFEDYEEPKEYWYIEPNGVIARIDEWDCCTENDREVMKSIGNYFDTGEEAMEAIDKLKAWKRLKDKGFRFEGWRTWEEVTGLSCFDKGVAHSYYAGFTFRSEDRLEKDSQVKADLDLLFGGEE